MSKLWTTLRAVLAWLVRWFRPPRWLRPPPAPALPVEQPELRPRAAPLYRAVLVDEQPETLELGVCYLVGEAEHRWFGAFLCPCGCAARVVVNLLPDMRPRWKVEIHDNETITLWPSVNRQVGCRSHFVIRRGRTLWC